MNSRRSQAFTLIELLVVVSIIALLVSILLPALSKARETAKKVVCSTNMHSVGTGCFAYDNDHGHVPYPKVTEKDKVRHDGGTAWGQSLLNKVYQNEFEVGPENDRTGVGWAGTGLLIQGGYIGDDMMILWCPTKKLAGDGTYPHHNEEDFKDFDRWPEFFAANPHAYGHNHVLSAYRYQAIEPVDLMASGQLEDLGTQRFGTYRDRRHSGNPLKIALLDEPGTNSDDDPTVVEGSTHKGGINVLRWDSSVSFIREDFAAVSAFRYSRWFIQHLDNR